MSTAAIVPAAGRGERLGDGLPKALRLVAGEPLVLHAVRGLAAAESISRIVVAAPPGNVDVVRRMLDHVADVDVVAGGATRSASVLGAVESLDVGVDVVLVHDAARPLTPLTVIEAVEQAVRAGHEAVVPAVPVVDTVKQVGTRDDGIVRVTGTVDRSTLRAVQTPQGFQREVLDAAYRAAARDRRLDATDDAGLVEALGYSVAVVEGDPQAFKVTRPLDLLLAEALIAARGPRLSTDGAK